MSNTAFMFRRTRKVLVPMRRAAGKNAALVASFDANLRRLGFALDADAVKALLDVPASDFGGIANDVIAEAKRIKGVKRYSPMYPNFPKQVMEASDAELYLNAIMHYYGDMVGLRILPVYEKAERPELDFDESRFKKVGVAYQQDFFATIMSVVNQKAGYGEQEREDISEFWEHLMQQPQGEFNFGNRENKAWFAAKAYRYLKFFPMGEVFKFDTATDVLRFAVALCDGDVSLAEKTRFKSFARSERRLILGLFNQINGLDEDFARRPETFKRLGERLHPREYSAQFPIAASAFATVRDNKRKPVTFNSAVENALSSGATSAAVSLLKTRPGEFARRLDEVLRSANNITQARAFVKAFDAVAAQVSAPVLLQARAALQADRGGNRIFFPKGNVSKFKAIPDTRGDIDLSVRNAAVEACNKGLVARFSEKGSLGKVYVDSALDGVTVPLTIRDASKGRVLGRGSRMPFNEKTNVLRFFIWWKDIDIGGRNGRVDIDLSAVLLDDNFNTVEAVAYYNLRGLGATHSGDITSAPHGASEFIDIDPAKVLERGARYVAMTVHSFSRQNLSDIPEVFAGYMERNDHDSGEVYDPRTVENRVDLTTPTTNSVPYIFDMKTGEAIWIDMALRLGGYGYGGNNAASTSLTTENLVSAVVRKNYPSLGDLFRLHAKARGTLVDSPAEADVVFNLDNAFRTEEVLDKYL